MPRKRLGESPTQVVTVRLPGEAVEAIRESGSEVTQQIREAIYRDPHFAVVMAIKKGTLVRPESCEECGKKCKPHAHHDDYRRPVDVRWLCPACHGAWHKENEPDGKSEIRTKRVVVF